ncbi:MAG: MBL fold metallo-hydrolase [Ascidiaceihabitans sp.]|nr:MBL fold metallo-hydrolase [Ascidiaceihabitans sp.]
MTPPDDFDPVIGIAETLEPGLRRIVAPNPSPMTYRGTNTYLLGTTDIAVIDPGPDSTAHLNAILAAIAPDQRISHIIVTHSHLDHSPLARPLAQRCGAPILAFGAATAGRSVVMQQIADSGLVGGGEGIDTDFEPDQILADGDTIVGTDWSLNVIHTPGHLGNHICLEWNDACFTADHVMGWASSLVSPPDGDLTDFMASCARLQDRTWRVFYAGHGAAIDDPNTRLEWLIGHRKAREAAILAHLANGPANASALARAIYLETPVALQGAATRNILAHLVDLKERFLISPIGDLTAKADFRLT